MPSEQGVQEAEKEFGKPRPFPLNAAQTRYLLVLQQKAEVPSHNSDSLEPPSISMREGRLLSTFCYAPGTHELAWTHSRNGLATIGPPDVAQLRQTNARIGFR